MNIFYLLSSLLITTINIHSLECQNGGIPILTRTQYQPYILQFKCLCPYKFVGESCIYFRGTYCYLDTQQSLKSSQSLGDTTLKFELSCYIKKLKNKNSTILYNNQPNGFYKLPLTHQQIQLQLLQQNYYIDQNYKIIWQNNTNNFDQNGSLIKNDNDTRTDQQIINSYPKYQFNYTSTFLGIPLYHSIITYKLTSIQFTKKSYNLTSPSIIFSQQIINRSRIITGQFNIKLLKQWEEFQVSKIQLQFDQFYGNNFIIRHRMSIKNAKWRLFDQDFQRGEIISGDSSKLPGSIKILLIFISIFTFLWCGRTFVSFYKSSLTHSHENQQ